MKRFLRLGFSCLLCLVIAFCFSGFGRKSKPKKTPEQEASEIQHLMAQAQAEADASTAAAQSSSSQAGSEPAYPFVETEVDMEGRSADDCRADNDACLQTILAARQQCEQAGSGENQGACDEAFTKAGNNCQIVYEQCLRAALAGPHDPDDVSRESAPARADG